MNYETKRRVEEMLARTGHVLSVGDLDALIDLDRLAEKMAGQEGIGAEVLARPVFLSGVPCWPLTLEHSHYQQEALAQWLTNEEEFTVALLWLTTLERVEPEYWQEKAARLAISRWARSCPWNEIDCQTVFALRYRFRADAAPGDDNQMDQTGRVLMLLVREYGRDVDFWRYQAPIEYIDAAIADWNARQAEQAEQFRRLHGRGVLVGGPRVQHARAFRLKAQEIEESWLAKKS
jgi:hypothetical protein